MFCIAYILIIFWRRPTCRAICNMGLNYQQLPRTDSSFLSPNNIHHGVVGVQYADDGNQLAPAASTTPGQKTEVAARSRKLVSVGAPTPRSPSEIDVFECGIRIQAGSVLMGAILLYMVVSMSLVLFDKWIISDFGFRAPLTLIMSTNVIIHMVSSLMRCCVRNKSWEVDGSPLVQGLSWSQLLRKVVPVGAVFGLEVGISAVGLQTMGVGFHTMVRATLPIFVLLFSVAMGLEGMRIGLFVVVVMVSGGITLLSLGEHNDLQQNFPMVGFGLTLLSGVLAGFKWTLSQVLLQGRGLPCVAESASANERINPLTLLHYVSSSSAVALSPFVCFLELGTLRSMAQEFSFEKNVQAIGVLAVCGLLALLLTLLEFGFIKHVSSLSLCIVAVVKELILVSFSVALMGEPLSAMTGLGFVVTLLGVSFYKLVRKGPPPGSKMRGHDTTTESQSLVKGHNPESDHRRFLLTGEVPSSAAVGDHGNIRISPV